MGDSQLKLVLILSIPQFLIWFFYIPWYAIFYNPFDQEWRIEKNIEFNSCLHNIFFQSSTHDPNHSKLKRFFYSMLCFFAFSKNTKASLQHFLYGTIIRKNPTFNDGRISDTRESWDRCFTFGMIWGYHYACFAVQELYNERSMSKNSVSGPI